LESIATMCGPGTGSNGHDSGLAAIEREAFEDVLKKLLESETKKRSGMRGLDDQRRDQIIAGALLVDQLFKRLNLRRIQICGSAPPAGIFLDYLERRVREAA